MFVQTSHQKRRGATAVEMAAVISVLVVLLFGIFEYCMVIYSTQVVENAAREGARYAVVNSADATLVADTQAVVINFMGGLDTKLSAYNCDVYLADSGGNKIGAASTAQFGQYVCVEVSGVYVPMTPGLALLSSFTIRSKSNMGSEAN